MGHARDQARAVPRSQGSAAHGQGSLRPGTGSSGLVTALRGGRPGPPTLADCWASRRAQEPYRQDQCSGLELAR